MQWVVNAYLLPLSALLLLGGALGDHFGRRRLLVIGTSMFAVASLVCALAPSLPLLLAARAAQGVGAALLLPNSLALLNAAFRARSAAARSGSGRPPGAATAAIAPLIGGWLVGTRRLAGDLLHQPAARARRDPAGAAVRRGKPRSRRRPDRLCRRAAGDRRARRRHLCADLVVGDRALSTIAR